MADHLQATLVERALQMALGRRSPHGDVLHHSDQGSQYTSTRVQSLRAKHHIQVSMKGGGTCSDHAPMASFIGTLTTAFADARFAPRADARQAIFEYIDVWDNRQRLHSSLGYLSPVAFEQRQADEMKTVRSNGARSLSLSTLRRTQLLEQIVAEITCANDDDDDDNDDSNDDDRCHTTGGAVVVAAAGNSGDSMPQYPAAEAVEGTVAVAAST